MDETPAMSDGAAPAWASVGNASAEIRETHTGIVVLIGDKAYKIKKPIVTGLPEFQHTGQA
jgi:aminoglycoside phosphotransferase family enzyme